MPRALEIQSAGGEEGGLPVPRTARSGVCGTLPGSRSRGRSSKAKPSNLEVGQKATRQVSGLSESFHVWKNAIARSIVTGVPWRLWGSAQRDAGATGRCPLKGVGGRGGGARRKRGRGPNASFSASNSETLSHRQFSQQSQVRAIGLLQRKIMFWTELLVASDQNHCSAPTFLHLSHFPNYSSLPTRLWGIKDRSKSLRGNVNNKNSSFNESDLIWTCVCVCVRKSSIRQHN